MKKSHSGEKLYRFFVLTALIALAVTVLVPVLWVILSSVKDNSEFYQSPWAFPENPDFSNFSKAWESANMGSYFLNSAVVTALSLSILFLTAVPCAYVLSRFQFKARRALKVLFMAGLFINVSYLVIPIFLMLVDINSLIGYPLLTNNRLILAVIYAATALPFTIYLLSGYFESIPRDYEEAAALDGCSNTRTLLQIIVPMARPALITALLFNFLSFWNEYIIAITLMTDDRAKTLPVGLMNLMKAQNAAAQYGKMYAGLVIVMLPTLILYIILQKKLTEGLSGTGVKG